MTYDYLIVGAGLFGATCARLLTDAGKKVLVIEKMDHIGGNCADYERDGIIICRHGGHIFHTNSDKVWQWVNQFAEFTRYEHKVKAKYNHRIYSFPINRLTYEQFGLPINKASTAILWDIFFKAYSEKKWGKPIDQIPESITGRVNVRTTYDDRYFTDKYQGMPVGGYSKFIGRILEGIAVEKKVDYFADEDLARAADTVIYSGPIDRLFDFDRGKLEYISAEYRTLKERGDYQGCETVNHHDRKTPYTRTMEWKHYYHQNLPYTFFTYEYPRNTGEPYYPFPDERNLGIYKQYRELADKEQWLRVGGRLGSYKYLNMDQTIAQAIRLVEREL